MKTCSIEVFISHNSGEKLLESCYIDFAEVLSETSPGDSPGRIVQDRQETGEEIYRQLPVVEIAE